MHVGSRKHMWKHKHLCAVQTVDPPRNITVQHVVRNQGMQCTISTQTSRGAKTTTHAGDSRLGHFRRRFVGQRLLMATCGLGGPMNPKSKTCFRYVPTNATEDIIYIAKNKLLPNADILSSLVFLSKSVWHTVAKRVLAKVLAKALASCFPSWHLYKTRSKKQCF